MIERHRQWVNLYNANLDAAPAHRESLATLRKQLQQWERAHMDPAPIPVTSERQTKAWLVREDASHPTARTPRPIRPVDAASSRFVSPHQGAGPRGGNTAPILGRLHSAAPHVDLAPLIDPNPTFNPQGAKLALSMWRHGLAPRPRWHLARLPGGIYSPWIWQRRRMDDAESLSEKRPSFSEPSEEVVASDMEPPSELVARNWSWAKKMYANAVFSFITLLTTYTSGVYSPGIKEMRRDFIVSTEVAQLGTSLYMFALGFGALLWGPLSQTMGRRPVFLMSLVGMTCFNLGVCLSPDMHTLLVFRAMAGFSCSATFVNVAGSIVDMTTERDRIPYNSIFRAVTFMGPVLAALLGAVAVHESTWRWNLRSIPIASFVCLVLYALTVPETYLPILLEHKRLKDEEDLEELAEHHSWWVRQAHHWQHLMPRKAFWEVLWRRVRESLPLPWTLLFREPLVMVVTFYTSLLYGLLYASLLFFPTVWGEMRGLTAIQVGYTYFAVLAGFLLSTLIVGLWIQNVNYVRAYDEGRHEPELRLRFGLFSIFFVPVGLFIFAWTAPFPHVHWIGPCIGIVCFSFGMLAVFNSWMAYLTDTYSNNTAAVIAILTFCRSLLAGGFPLFTQQMIAAMTFQGAMSMFAGIAVPLTGAGLVMALYGNRLRHKSKYAVYG